MSAIVSLVSFIVDAIKQLISMVGMAVNTFTSLFSLLPPAISVSAGVLVTVCVIYKILGRENQS